MLAAERIVLTDRQTTSVHHNAMLVKDGTFGSCHSILFKFIFPSFSYLKLIKFPFKLFTPNFSKLSPISPTLNSFQFPKNLYQISST